MGSEFGGTEVDLRYRTVHHVAATRCGNHSGFSREVSGVVAVVCYIAFGNIKQVQTETAEVDDAHEGYAVIFGQCCIDFTGDDAGVFVQQVPNLLNVQDSVSRIGAENKVGSGQATMCQQFAHSFYVAEENNVIVGCGAIGPYWDKTDESSLFTIFVLPEYQGRRIGRRIVETLEKDEYALRAKRIEIPASITGLEFYKKLGYDYKDNVTVPDEEGLYRLEKYR